jgi:uncharacterized protein (DUF2141 family)
MSRSRIIKTGFAALALISCGAASTAAAELNITVAGIQSDAGAIMIGVYAEPVGFAHAIATSTETGLLNDKSRLVGLSMRAKTGMQNFTIGPVPPGRYAVIVFHDENDNGQLDENGWGVPTEGYGFSNDATAFLAAPSFDAAAVTVDETAGNILVVLSYPVTTTSANLSELQELFLGK